MSRKPTLAITMGDPGGIGPEIIIKAWPVLSRMAKLCVFGHRNVLKEASRLVGRRAVSDEFIFEPALNVTRRSSKKRWLKKWNEGPGEISPLPFTQRGRLIGNRLGLGGRGNLSALGQLL